MLGYRRRASSKATMKLTIVATGHAVRTLRMSGLLSLVDSLSCLPYSQIRLSLTPFLVPHFLTHHTLGHRRQVIYTGSVTLQAHSDPSTSSMAPTAYNVSRAEP